MTVELSIIVPAYNAEKYLEACIESIMASTYRNFEVLLVDDGSTDGTGILCDKLAEKYDQIRVFHTENQGVAKARNWGINHASGKYIGCVDSDDVITPKLFEVLISGMSADIQMACCRFHKCKRDEIEPLVSHGAYTICTGGDIANQIVCNYYGAYLWSKLFHKDLLDQHHLRFKPGVIMEDQYFVADYLKICNKACFFEDALYYYFDTPGSILNTFRSKTRVEHKYMHMPRSWAYTADAVASHREVFRETAMRAAMSYQSVLRKLDPEDDEFTAEAIAYMKKYNHLLLRHRWGIPYFVSGCILCLNYRLWKRIFRRVK